MKVIKQLAEMEAFRNALRLEGQQVALVPTMGALHEGHVTLIREAAAASDVVIVSIFVNPLQFGPDEDFHKYPRDLDGDSAIGAAAGASCIFAPSVDEMTPEGQVVTVDPGAMAERLCGFYRPGHFRGVCTIVLKLLNLVQPHVVLFGWKDAQQLIILKKMVTDLNVGVKLQGVEIVREESGLALSSRNRYLTGTGQQLALGLARTLSRVKALYEETGNLTRENLLAVRQQVSEEWPGLDIQYLEMVDIDNLEPLQHVRPGGTLVAMAAFVGKTRLIDNLRL